MSHDVGVMLGSASLALGTESKYFVPREYVIQLCYFHIFISNWRTELSLESPKTYFKVLYVEEVELLSFVNFRTRANSETR